MKLAVLLALHIIWPPHVEASTGANCEVIVTSLADGNCQNAKLIPGTARWWKACGYIWRDNAGPDNWIDRQVIKTDTRRKPALLACDEFLSAWEKLMGAKRARTPARVD